MQYPWPLFVAVAGAGLVMFVVLRLLKNRPPPPSPGPPLRLNVAELGDAGPPRGPGLECYHIGVRLAAVVVAPVGRSELPDADELNVLLDSLAPGLSNIFVGHGTRFYRWPAQLSPRGFAHAFFSEAPLPGDRGKGSPWCALAGRSDALNRPLMIGLIMRAAAPNALGQSFIESAHKWLDALRVQG
ncbi:MAG: hypothetical protein AB7O62_20395 [Pirellulales bacterium]